jgi:hypothetical protein
MNQPREIAFRDRSLGYKIAVCGLSIGLVACLLIMAASETYLTAAAGIGCVLGVILAVIIRKS